MDWLTVALIVFMSGVLYSAILGPQKHYARISIFCWALVLIITYLGLQIEVITYPLVIISLGTGGAMYLSRLKWYLSKTSA